MVPWPRDEGGGREGMGVTGGGRRRCFDNTTTKNINVFDSYSHGRPSQIFTKLLEKWENCHDGAKQSDPHVLSCGIRLTGRPACRAYVR